MRIVRTSQPTVPIGLDRSNPLTRGLDFAINWGLHKRDAYNAGSGGGLIVVAGASEDANYDHGVGRNGRWQTRYSTNYNGHYWAPEKTQAAIPRTFVVVTDKIIGIPGSSQSRIAAFMEFNSSVGFGGVTGYAIVRSYSSTAISETAGDYENSVVGFNYVDTNYRIYNRGLEVATSGQGLGNAKLLGFGGIETGYISGQFRSVLTLAWDHLLTAAEHAEIARNPWQVFEPEKRTIFLPPVVTSTTKKWKRSMSPPVRTTQPQYNAPIDDTNPITRGLVVALTPYSRFDRSITPEAGGTYAVKHSKVGRVMRGGLVSGGEVVASKYGVANTTIVLIDAVLDADTNGSWWMASNHAYKDTATAYPNDINTFGVRTCHTYGDVTIWVRDNSGSSFAAVVNSAPANLAPASGEVLVRGATIDNTLLVQGWSASGEKTNSDATLVGKTIVMPSQPLKPPTFGMDDSNLGTGDVVTYQALALRWNRVLSDGEMRSVMRNPWQVFKPEDRVAWFDHVSGSPYPTLSLAQLINLLQTQATPRVTITVP